MTNSKKIKSALISVYYKDNLDKIVLKLNELDVRIYSTGGTQSFIKELGVEVTAVEELTTYPSILGGRVKTLHPKIFGGILARRDSQQDIHQLGEYEIPEIDLVIVDLYPFEQTVASGAADADIIEKIDIGGISLIRAAAKNFKDVLIVSSREQYSKLQALLCDKNGHTDLDDRKQFAAEAFDTSSHYDTAIYNYFATQTNSDSLKISIQNKESLRYGENPHQKGAFYGDFENLFEKIQGKEISYNNLLDIDAAVNLISEFDETTVAILKHNNACGLASRDTLLEAWKDALAGDPVSAFGGIIVCNRPVDQQTATEIDKLFYEVIIAPEFSVEALAVLQAKKTRIILRIKNTNFDNMSCRSILNGMLVQDRDLKTETTNDLKTITNKQPDAKQTDDLLFANKIVKHSKSNCIVLAQNKQLVGSGVGMTSRVDALRHAISKAKEFNLPLVGSVMASDAYFPFADSVEIAHKEGVTAVIQPGGSKNDQLSVDYCNNNSMSMVFTGTRHFKH